MEGIRRHSFKHLLVLNSGINLGILEIFLILVNFNFFIYKEVEFDLSHGVK